MTTKKKYNRSFPERTVQLSYEQDKIKVSALEPGISEGCIYKWRSECRVHVEAGFQGHEVDRLSSV